MPQYLSRSDEAQRSTTKIAPIGLKRWALLVWDEAKTEKRC